MYQKLTARLAGLILLAITLMPTACIKDKCSEQKTYTFYTPVFKQKTDVLASIKSNVAREIEKPGKIYIHGNYIFLNDVDKGVHVIDNSNPSNPNRIAFVDIPGNIDMAVSGNTLYADMYGDLVAIDISDPRDVKLVKTVENVFPERSWIGGFAQRNGELIVGWIEKDTTVTENCSRASGPDIFRERGDVFFYASSSKANVSVSPVGTGGSMAKFTIAQDYLYTVDRHTLKCYSISNPSDPVKKSEVSAGFDVETIYPFGNALFIGTMGGMNIFDITNPEAPAVKSNFMHARACDPVITDGKHAFVTLRAGTICGPAENELLVLNVEDLASPSLVKRYSMTNPAGLAKDGDLLFICDGKDGLKAYEAGDVLNLQLVRKMGNLDTYDVIAVNGIALVVAKDGLYQYRYTENGQLTLLSKLPVKAEL